MRGVEEVELYIDMLYDVFYFHFQTTFPPVYLSKS